MLRAVTVVALAFCLAGVLGRPSKVEQELRELVKTDNDKREMEDEKQVTFQPLCSKGGPLELLNFSPGAFLNIFSDMTFGCGGLVAEWNYYAYQPGIFYAAVWRPLGSDNFMLVGKNRIWALESGQMTYSVPIGERIMAREDDVIGIHYDRQADAEFGGVVPYEDDRNRPSSCCEGLTTYAFHNSDHRNEDIYIGKEVDDIVEGVRRVPAIEAVLKAPSNDMGIVMELGYDPEEAEGLDEWTNAIYITDPSQSASRAGTVVSWDMYAQNTGTVYLQVWRALAENEYMLVGETHVIADEIGPLHIELSDYDRLDIEIDDTIGIYFPDEAIVPYDFYQPCNDVSRIRYFKPEVWSKPGVWDMVLFEEGLDHWGPCRKYSFNARILIDRDNAPGVSEPGEPGGDVDSSEEVGDGTCGVPAISPQTHQNRIVGGVPAIPHSWPWTVSLRLSPGGGGHYCGGSLIAPQWVVTAAHCDPTTSEAVVFAMHSKTTANAQQEEIGVAQVILHESYNSPKSHANDIALIKLEHPVTFRDEISPVCLPTVDTSRIGNAGETVFTTGWGDLSSGGPDPEVLMQVAVPVVDHDTCDSEPYYDGALTEDMLCAGLEEGGKDSCQGDSGGPLVTEVNGRWVLTGVVSWGYGCADARKPGIYARVSHFVDWIHQNIEENS